MVRGWEREVRSVGFGVGSDEEGMRRIWYGYSVGEDEDRS
jgi:hypothetical protein